MRWFFTLLMFALIGSSGLAQEGYHCDPVSTSFVKDVKPDNAELDPGGGGTGGGSGGGGGGGSVNPGNPGSGGGGCNVVCERVCQLVSALSCAGASPSCGPNAPFCAAGCTVVLFWACQDICNCRPR
ncbi:hypothetical protein DV704_12030 [Meiothermus sp. QL-1]|nr:hypothetical protein DV704_12030 [Meiothermus sp. QL-1]